MKKALAGLRYLHPLCFVLAPVCSLYGLNRAEVASQELLRPIVVLVLGALVLTIVFYFLGRRSLDRATLATALVGFALFSFDTVYQRMDGLYCGIVALIAPSLLDFHEVIRATVVWSVLLLVALGLLLRLRFPVERLWIPLWLMGVGYLAPALGELARPVPVRTLASGETTPLRETTPLPRSSSTGADAPDFYCIVLDAYGRHDQLQRVHGFDNRPFLQELERRGFQVLSRSRANYLQTVLCVASFLNLNYLPTDNALEGLEVVTPWIQDAKVLSLFRARGYRIVDVPSDFSPTWLKDSDLRLTETGPTRTYQSGLERLLIGRTPFVVTLFYDTAAYDQHRTQLLAGLRHLPETAQIPGPKFVFVHLLAPHPPFVLGAKGEAVYPVKAQFSLGDATDFADQDRGDYSKRYSAQLQGLNTYLLEALDALQRQQTRPAVIWILGDHGSRRDTDWKSLERTDLQEALSNLQAISVPGGAPFLTDDLTPINTLRLTLKHVYGEKLERLPDKSYYSPLRQPLRFTEVTDRLK